MRYDTRAVMQEAWSFRRKGIQDFAQALSMAWDNAKTRREAKETAGITEDTHTWAGWKALGYEVIHESRSLYKATLHDPSTKNGTRLTCFFGQSQVQPITA